MNNILELWILLPVYLRKHTHKHKSPILQIGQREDSCIFIFPFFIFFWGGFERNPFTLINHKLFSKVKYLNKM